MSSNTFLSDIESGNLKKVQTRLKKEKPTLICSEPNKPGIQFSLLHKAVEVADLQIVEALLQAGANLNASDSQGSTVLHWLAKQDTDAACSILGYFEKKRVNLNAINNSQDTPLHIAARMGNTTMLAALLKAGAEAQSSILTDHSSALQTAAEAGCVTAVDILIKHGAAFNRQDGASFTPLMHLLAQGHARLAMSMLTRGDCNVNAQDKAQGYTALMMVVTGPSPDSALAAALLAAGASPDVCDTLPGSMDTALHAAVRQQQAELVQLLARHSQQLGARNAKNESSLSIALKLEHDGMVEVLLAAGADVGPDGARLLEDALNNKKDGVLSQLVKSVKESVLKEAELDFRRCAAAGLPGAALAYLQRCEPEAGDKSLDALGSSSLHIAVEVGGPVELLEGLMKKRGVSPNLQNKEGDTPLHIAARLGNVVACRALFESGADPTRRNNKNRTPRSQLKVPDSTKDFLLEAEEAAKQAKAARNSALWDDKMKATQTENATTMHVC